jgi:predicted DNA-binding protein with PD1-like motif
MRRLTQPGPTAVERIESFRDRFYLVDLTLAAGRTLEQAVARPLIGAGLHAAVLEIEGLELAPLRYVMPGPADGPAHVAYFSAPREVPRALAERANVTFGFVDGVARLHCHAYWAEPDGTRRGGHILLDESIVARSCQARAWGFRELGIRAEADPETNFTLLRPVRLAQAATSMSDSPSSTPPGDNLHVAKGAAAVLARIRPNEDLFHAVEEIARRHDMRDAVVRGSLGSLVGARFADGRMVPDRATEVLVRRGVVHNGIAELDLAVVDMRGEVHTGPLERGENAVCITFDVLLEQHASGSPRRSPARTRQDR